MIKRIIFFLILGGQSAGVDYLVYRGITLLGIWDASISKALGYIAGSLFAYLVNCFWTFGNRAHQENNYFWFCTLYALTLLINIYVNGSMLKLMPDYKYSVQAAFLIATAISASLNFLGMNYFVFKDKYYRRLK